MKTKLLCAILFAFELSSHAISVPYTEYIAAGGTCSAELANCPSGWLANGSFSRDDVSSPIPGELVTGIAEECNVDNCGTCPKNPLPFECSTTLQKTNTLTMYVHRAIEAGIPALKVKLEREVSWSDGETVSMTGTATFTADPCYLTKGELTFEYYKAKGTKVQHTYSGNTTTSPYMKTFYPNCRINHPSYLVCNQNPSTESTNKGDHYHSVTLTAKFLSSEKCEDCEPG